MSQNHKLLSIVIPCFNESKNIPPLVIEILKYIPRNWNYEIIFVDDNSPDGTFEVIKNLAKKNRNIKGISMYKRAGLQPSLLAGIQKARGNVIINMDADLQHPPNLIPKMIEAWEKGYDAVLPIKKEDKSSGYFKKTLRHVGYKTWDFLSQGVLTQRISEFRLIDRHIADYLIGSNEREAYIRGLVSLASKNPFFIPYKVGKRKYGKSSFNIPRLINVFLTGMVSFSTRPLRIAIIVGLISLPLAIIGLIISLSIILINPSYSNLTSLPLSFVQLILNCFTILYLGILGEYIGVLFKEIKHRPTYTIGEVVNL